jgi:hypothetical protein
MHLERMIAIEQPPFLKPPTESHLVSSLFTREHGLTRERVSHVSPCSRAKSRSRVGPRFHA